MGKTVPEVLDTQDRGDKTNGCEKNLNDRKL